MSARSSPGLFLEFVEALCAHELFELLSELRRIVGVGGWRPAGVVMVTAVRHGWDDTREEIGLPLEDSQGVESRWCLVWWMRTKTSRAAMGRIGEVEGGKDGERDDDGRRPQQHSTAESLPRLARARAIDNATGGEERKATAFRSRRKKDQRQDREETGIRRATAEEPVGEGKGRKGSVAEQRA